MKYVLKINVIFILYHKYYKKSRSFLYFLEKCGKIRGGRVAEWFKALVLKTSMGNPHHRFESCPFRQ